MSPRAYRTHCFLNPFRSRMFPNPKGQQDLATLGYKLLEMRAEQGPHGATTVDGLSGSDPEPSPIVPIRKVSGHFSHLNLIVC